MDPDTAIREIFSYNMKAWVLIVLLCLLGSLAKIWFKK